MYFLRGRGQSLPILNGSFYDLKKKYPQEVPKSENLPGIKPKNPGTRNTRLMF